jgi:hypothetical protein
MLSTDSDHQGEDNSGLELDLYTRIMIWAPFVQDYRREKKKNHMIVEGDQTFSDAEHEILCVCLYSVSVAIDHLSQNCGGPELHDPRCGLITAVAVLEADGGCRWSW